MLREADKGQAEGDTERREPGVAREQQKHAVRRATGQIWQIWLPTKLETARKPDDERGRETKRDEWSREGRKTSVVPGLQSDKVEDVREQRD